MKSKKVLIGLIVAAFFGGAHVASAQPKANYHNDLIEIGPDNVGGRVRAIIVDEADPTHNTLYAGGVAGGLYKKMGQGYWQYMPCHMNGYELTLPISDMVQLHDNSLLIATGEGFIGNHGVNNDVMSPKGHGIFHFDPSDESYQLLSKTNPSVYPEWSYINRLATIERNGFLYIYAATNEGLYRWKLNSADPDWTAEPSLVVSGMIHDVVIISADNIAYVSGPGKLYRIGNVVEESAAIDVTASNSAFASAGRIELSANTAHKLDAATGNYVHTTYLYAVVVDTVGLLNAVYLSYDQQNWTRLTTNTIAPFTRQKPGTINASIAIDPRDYKTIYVGGSNLYKGSGFVENSYYQWTMMSYNEYNLNAGNYMGQVYTSPMFLHSGINQIVPTFTVNEDNDTSWVVYFATDGGVYKEVNDTFINLNKGFNTVQFNDIAVSPDGSIIGGAVDNSCPFIQARNAHHGSVPTNQWYDNDTASIMNHMASITWFGNGGGVASSMFQRIIPTVRRSIFVSSEPGSFSFAGGMGNSTVASMGRACNDYADYSNTQTWTIAEGFLSDVVPNSNPIPQIKLWETTNNTIWNDKITFTIDTTMTYIHNGVETQLSGNTTIVPGDKILVCSKPNFDYPFYHTFDTTFVVKNMLKHTVHNPVVSRIIVNGINTNGNGVVYLNCTPNYYRNVWDPNEAVSATGDALERLMHWAPLYVTSEGYGLGAIAFSRDGKSIYCNVYDKETMESFVVRIYDFVNADVNNSNTMKTQLTYTPDFEGMSRITHFDYIYAPDGGLFKRPLTSIVVDPRDGEDNLIFTFGGYSVLEPNMVYVKNASNESTRTVTALTVNNSEYAMGTADPVYSALIEYKTGNVYAGTEKGVFISPVTNPTWQSFGAFAGVPVTSIVQQTKSLERQRFQVREGVNLETYIFAKTKYPYAIYFGTYGRGVFMDTTYVEDHVAEICDPEDWVGINTVDKGDNQVKIYPNPVVDNATLELTVVNGGNAIVKIYDLNGKLVHTESLGILSEGVHQYSLDCSKFSHGMYLVNINLGKESATSKLIVR